MTRVQLEQALCREGIDLSPIQQTIKALIGVGLFPASKSGGGRAAAVVTAEHIVAVFLAMTSLVPTVHSGQYVAAMPEFYRKEVLESMIMGNRDGFTFRRQLNGISVGVEPDIGPWQRLLASTIADIAA